MNIRDSRFSKFLTTLTLNRIGDVQETKDILVSVPHLLQQNSIWENIFLPANRGFSDVDKYELSLENSLQSIERMIDILHSGAEKIPLVDAIELSFLLRDYASDKLWKEFNSTNLLFIFESDEIPIEDNYEKWIREHVDCSRWQEINLQRKKEVSRLDKYIKIQYNIGSRYDRPSNGISYCNAEKFGRELRDILTEDGGFLSYYTGTGDIQYLYIDDKEYDYDAVNNGVDEYTINITSGSSVEHLICDYVADIKDLIDLFIALSECYYDHSTEDRLRELLSQ